MFAGRKYYAYVPKDDGSEPLGTMAHHLFELKTHRGAVERVRRVLGPKFRLYTYRNFYDDSTFSLVLDTWRLS